jgi:Concanavalin A-like lectin/glucanases superfamily
VNLGRGRRLPAPLQGLQGMTALLVLALCAVLAAVPSSSAAFVARVANTTNTVATNPYFTCKAAVVGNAAYFAHPFDDNPPSNQASARDVSGNNRPGTYQNTATHNTSGVCPRDTSSGSTSFDGTSDFVTTPSLWPAPMVFSEEVWFRTSVAQGVLVGYSNSLLGLIPTNYDRHVYLITGGRLTFGVYNAGYVTITSPAGYADGVWHHMVSTMSAAGMRLYVDGALVASNTNTAAENSSGYFRFAQNLLTGWPNAPSSTYFKGELAYGAVYASALSASDVAAHYAAGR